MTSRLARALMLATSLFLGQGSSFLVQTLLVSKGRLDVTAALGLAMALVSLVQWSADWGGGAILPALASSRELGFTLREALIGRVLVAFPLAAVSLAVGLVWGDTDPLVRGALVGGMAVPLAWSVNLTGYLDGHMRGAVVAPYQSLPWLLSSAAATSLLVPEWSAHRWTIGVAVGLAFAAGCGLCCLRQHAYSKLLDGHRGTGLLPTRGSYSYVRMGFAYILGELPNQFYGRALILLVTAYSTPSVTGIYIYVRQLLSAIAQLLTVVRRLEYVYLARLAQQSTVHFKDFIASQKLSLLSCFLFPVVVASVYLFVRHVFDLHLGHFDSILPYLLAFSVTIPFWGISASAGQLIIFKGFVHYYSMIMLTSVFSLFCITWIVFPYVGVPAIILTDTFGFLFQAVCYWWLVQRLHRVAVPALDGRIAEAEREAMSEVSHPRDEWASRVVSL